MCVCACVRASTLLNTNISATSQPITIKFYQKHHWVGGKVASGFGPGRIRTLVTMATDSSHRLTMGKTGKNLFRNHIAQSIHILCVAIFINPANCAPGVHTGPAPGASWVKHKKIFSKTTRPRAFIFCLKQCIVVLFINPANHSPGVKNGPASGVISSHRLTMGKHKKIFFSETTRPRALIFCM